MIDPDHLVLNVIRPVLKSLELYSVAAERLVLGTACKESECGEWLVQLGNVKDGGLGIYQMEAATYYDIWLNYLAYQTKLGPKVKKLSAGLVLSNAEEMIGNLFLATAMCRVHYRRVPAAIPTDLPGQAAYWNKYYNCNPNYGTEAEYIAAWKRCVKIEWV